MLLQHVGCLLRPDAGRAGDLVRRVAAQRDEVRHLRRLDAVALAHLGRPDPRELGDALAPAAGSSRGRETSWNASRSEVATSTGPGQASARAGREEVVGLVAGRLRDRGSRTTRRAPAGGRAARRSSPRTRAPTGRRAAPRGGRWACRACPSRRAPTPAARSPRAAAGSRRSRRARCSADRLRQGVVGAVGERVAVDREQETAHSDASSALDRGHQPVGRVRAASAAPGRARSSSSIGGAVPHAPGLEPAQAVGALDPRRHERHAGLERDPRRARVRAAPRASSAGPSAAACPPGTSRSRCPARASRTAVSIAS